MEFEEVFASETTEISIVELRVSDVNDRCAGLETHLCQNENDQTRLFDFDFKFRSEVSCYPGDIGTRPLLYNRPFFIEQAGSMDVWRTRQ